MCEYQIFNPENFKEPPMCDYTKQRCTFCVVGNKKTHNEAKTKENNNG